MGKAVLLFVIGVMLGLLAMGLTVAAVEWAGVHLYPLPPGLDPTRPEDLARILAEAPLGALLSVVAAWVLGAFVGGGVASVVSRRWPRAAAVCVGLAVVVAAWSMQSEITGHPRWMTLCGLLLPVPAALLAAWRAGPRRQPSRH